VLPTRLLLRLGLLFLSLCAWLTVTACSSGGGGKLQDGGGGGDVLVLDAFGDLPPGCPPGGPNDKGVGLPCTENGNQCAGRGLVCTCDTIFGVKGGAGTPCFCSLASLMPCTNFPAGYCGQNSSCCDYMGMASLCVPNACLSLNGSMCPIF
jgi:hypothetical protein